MNVKWGNVKHDLIQSIGIGEAQQVAAAAAVAGAETADCARALEEIHEVLRQPALAQVPVIDIGDRDDAASRAQVVDVPVTLFREPEMAGNAGGAPFSRTAHVRKQAWLEAAQA